ncbi:hypothetical protein BDF20DRAFT_828855 [Mycotypha africana]|uniref:uncharacterized protein n=2 Tax=Mycotypha africana TaxID=64632 RepID=UPI002300CF41|nr:uncharacterized protein BDF20DRAFT_828855 [Mycotypha africana]KAI8967869.1 hypothetical protein BDF20DRAFT_828855 [Mycotypha africana]
MANPIWKCNPSINDSRTLRQAIDAYRQDNLNAARSAPHSKLIKCCRPTISLDPILWLPMPFIERSRCLRYRLGWLPNNYSAHCLHHPSRTLTKDHAIECLNMHNRLQLPHDISDPISHLLNQLPTRPIKQRANAPVNWSIVWPIVQLLLFEVDYLQHEKMPPTPSETLGQLFLDWLYAPTTTNT